MMRPCFYLHIRSDMNEQDMQAGQRESVNKRLNVIPEASFRIVMMMRYPRTEGRLRLGVCPGTCLFFGGHYQLSTSMLLALPERTSLMSL